ncbi:MAG: hypothetical protein WDO73_04515 [Ignavibacteriota bacterium]
MQIPIDGFFHSVFLADLSDAGDVSIAPAVGGVYLVTFFLSEATTWQLRIVNTDAAAHTFVWVVGDSDAESQQPWINTAPTGSYNVFSGQDDTFAVVVTNSGTGTANLVAGAAPGAGFVVTTVPLPIPPNGSDNVIITYNGRRGGGTSDG